MYLDIYTIRGLPQWLSGKESACSARHRRCRFSPGLGRCPGRGHGNRLQYSCLENLMDRETRRSIVHST